MVALTNKREQEINRFIDENSKILPPEELASVSAAINDIVTKIRSAGLSVDRIVVAGSMKKGTAVRTDWDVDLVAFFHYPFVDYEREKFRTDLLLRIANLLKDSLSCEIKRKNAFLVSLIYKGISFDILTAYDATRTKNDQVREQRVNMRELVKNRKDKFTFSACFTESSCEFVATRRDESKERVTRAIKLAKIWNKTYFAKDQSHKAMLRSYAMELLICKIYEANKEQSTAQLFMTMLNIIDLAVQRKLSESWTTISFNDYFVSAPPRNPGRPLSIFDPCLPESDVVSDFEAWDKLANVARKTSSLFLSSTPMEIIFPRD